MVKKVVIQAAKLHNNNKPKPPLQVAHQIQKPHQLKRGQVQAVAVAHQIQVVAAWQAS